jgi:DNA modification methylase
MFSANRKDIPAHLMKYFRPKRIYKQRDDLMIPHRVYDALMIDGWYGRQDIVWHKPAPMPESVKNRCTKAHEYIFLLTKSARYYYDNEAIMEEANYDGRKDEQFKGAVKSYDGVMPDGQPQSFAQAGHARWQKNEDGIRVRNKRSVWTVNTKPHAFAHFAVYPEELIEPCIIAGCPEGGTVLDPFSGSGTTGRVAIRNRRKYVGLELNPEYITIQRERLTTEVRLI